MKNQIIHLPFLLTLVTGLSLITSCTSGDDEFIDPDNPSAFGIRHDLDLSMYERIATNESPYDTEDYPDFSPVFMFSYSLDGSSNEEFVATGTLIKSNWVLTAGHNFFVADEQSAPSPVSGIKVLVGNDPNNPGETLDVEELVFHPSWIEDNNDFLSANDLCLVKLTSSINDLVPATVNYEVSEPIGATTWYCGFGDYSGRPGQNPDLFSKKHSIENILDRKVEGITSSSQSGTYLGGLLAYDFDSPTGLINALGDDFVEEDEQLLGTGTSNATATDFEGATVEGDSGGPIFIKIDGVWKVCGVLSGGASEPIRNHQDSDYGDISVFIRTSTAADWIKSVIE
ncbi:MAG: trypsin-like serine protease [Cyclobacteriaceae bacterium]